jgi:chemotaxis protein methyltransferase CheR
MQDTVNANVTDSEFRQISDLVYRHCGINLHKGKRELVHARIARQLRSKGLHNFAEYKRLIEADESGYEFSALIDAISTNLTSFFRERQHFAYLSDVLLPKHIADADKKRSLRVWSAGCSSGEEPYSLAMTINEALVDHGTWDVKVLASDISRGMLRVAQAGIYDLERAKAIPLHFRAKYFKPFGGDGRAYQASLPLKNMIRFRYLNLIEKWPFKGPFDVIFCRNVMIYFDKQTQQKLVNQFYERLAPGGMLFTGHSESLAGLQHNFDYVQPTIYRRP